MGALMPGGEGGGWGFCRQSFLARQILYQFLQKKEKSKQIMYGSQNLPVTNNTVLRCLASFPLPHCHRVVRRPVREMVNTCPITTCTGLWRSTGEPVRAVPGHTRTRSVVRWLGYIPGIRGSQPHGRRPVRQTRNAMQNKA